MVLQITGLMACDPNGVIAKEGRLPWHYPLEIQFFRELIAGQVIVLGRKTYEEMPTWLLARSHSVIFSRRKQSTYPENLTVVSSIDAFLSLKRFPEHKACFLIGGAQLAETFFNHALLDAFVLTRVHQCYEGDTFFSLKHLLEWPRTRLITTTDFSIYYYTRPKDKR